jgi:hypothetical protein
MIIIYYLLGLFAIIEFANFLVYGGFVSKKITDVYMNLDESKLRLNQFNPSILSTNCYITNVPFSIFSKYHIEGLGTIPRWSKLHKRVNEYFAIACRNGQ